MWDGRHRYSRISIHSKIYNRNPGGWDRSVVSHCPLVDRLALSSTGVSLRDPQPQSAIDDCNEYATASFVSHPAEAFREDHEIDRYHDNDERAAANMNNTKDSMYERAAQYIKDEHLEEYIHIPANSTKLVDLIYIIYEMFGRQRGHKRTAITTKCVEILEKLCSEWKIVTQEYNNDVFKHPIFCRPDLDSPYGVESSVWEKDKKLDFQADAGTYRFYLEGHGTRIYVWTLATWSTINDSDAVFVFFSYNDEAAMEALFQGLDSFDKARRVENRIITVYGGSDIEISSKMSWDDLILPDDVIQRTKDDIEGWISAESRYKKLHVPYRRGYLFEGPPGNGKTATSRAIMSTYGFSAHMFNFTNPECGDSALQEAFKNAADDAPAVFLLEDIDRIFDSCHRTTNVTMQGLLNCLDGLATYDGVITIATANHPEVLDPAIRLRPGRFDVPVKFDNPSKALKVKYLTFALGRTGMSKVSAECIDEVAENTGKLSMAFVKSIFEAAAYISKGDIDDASMLEALSRAHKYYAAMEKKQDRSAGFKSGNDDSDHTRKSNAQHAAASSVCPSVGGAGRKTLTFP